MTILNLMKKVDISQKGQKHSGKRRNCSIRATSPFPTVFSKDLFGIHIKNESLLEKSLLATN